MKSNHNVPPVKKKKNTDGRDTWRFEENIASSLRLISKQEPDDPYFPVKAAIIVAKAVFIPLGDKLVSFFSGPPAPKPPEVDYPSNNKIVSKIKALDDERKEIKKQIKACVANQSAIDPKLIQRKEQIQDEILDLIFGKDKASLALNKLFAKLEDQIFILQAKRVAVTERIKVAKATIKNAKKSGAVSAVVVDPADILLKKQVIQEIDNLMVQKVELVRENIREHARKRVDIFFYTCIALYKLNVQVTKGSRAEVQMGVGSEITGTAACHASLVKSMTLTPIPPAKTVTDSLTDTLKTVADTAHAVADNLQAAAGKVQAAGNFMYTLFQPAPDTLPEPLPKAKAECEAEPEPVKPPIPAYFFEDSFLEEECNICHELPTVVNDFDGLMEGKWGHVSTLTEVGMDIINQVSRGELHPIQAMEKFAEIARMFFTAMDYEYFTSKSKESSVLLYKNAAMLVKKYQEEGTFSAYNPKSNCLLDDYVRLMLGLETKSSGLSTGEKFATFLSYTGYVNERIESAQKSLLTTKPMRVRIKEEIEQEKADDKEKKKAELAAAKATQQTSKGLSK